MPLPEVGERAPEFEAETLDGGPFRLAEALEAGPVVLFFGKRDCRATDVAAPIVEAIWDAYRDHVSAEETRLAMVGVALEEAAGAREFAAQHGLSFTVIIDAAGEVAARYGVESTPSLVLLRGRERLRTDSADVAAAEAYRTIDRVEGWSKRDVERLSDQIAARIGALPPDLFTGRPDVPGTLPG